MDLFLVEVKTPKGPADLYNLVGVIPGDPIFIPAEKSGCPLTQGSPL